MSIISQTTWDKFTQEEKDRVIKDYNNSAVEVRVRLEAYFGKENLNPKPLTYEDVVEELFDGKDTFYISNIGSIVLAEGGRLIYDKYKLPNNCTSRKQTEKLLAINRLLNVAKFLNKNEDGTLWKPNWKNRNELKYGISLLDGKINIEPVAIYNLYIVYFRTKELAQQCVSILGEDVIHLALGDY